MIWVVIGAIAVSIVAFFVYFFLIRWRRMARYGRLEVPGEGVVQLPAGTVTVYYEDAFKWRYSERPRPWSGFSVLVSGPDDQRIDLRQPKNATATKTAGKVRIPFGVIELPRAGAYRVRSQVDADATGPHVTFG
ncbi:MAG: hypothetical protein M3M99_03135 [Actinomycetota bacterium]|nr:hypothetical protein [Actinomycetota bacterium]